MLTPEKIQLLKIARVEYAQTGDPDALMLMADALPEALREIEERSMIQAVEYRDQKDR